MVFLDSGYSEVTHPVLRIMLVSASAFVNMDFGFAE